MPYLLQRQLMGHGALINQTSHLNTNFNSGEKLPAGLKLPVTFSIDMDFDGRAMPTLFVVPTLIARGNFIELLRRAGADNFDSYSARIINPETNELFDEYSVVNVIGAISAADLTKSEHFKLGQGLRVIDRIVLDRARIPIMHIFRLAEDPLQIIVSDRLAEIIISSGLPDVYLEQLEMNR